MVALPTSSIAKETSVLRSQRTFLLSQVLSTLTIAPSSRAFCIAQLLKAPGTLKLRVQAKYSTSTRKIPTKTPRMKKAIPH